MPQRSVEPVPQGEPPPDGTDEDLLAESLATPERFATIFDRYAPVVHGYLSRRPRNGSTPPNTASTRAGRSR